MTTLRITIAVNACDEADFVIRSCVKKQESVWASRLQRIGAAYRESDAIAKRITENPYAAKACFVKALASCGVSLVNAETLLAEKGWRHRMNLTWELLNEHERIEARSLDYQVYENYWPNLDFLDPSYLLPSLVV